MPVSKIVNEQEVLRWFEEGRTYEWMCDEYKRKYHLEVGPSMWGNFRRRRGLTRRIVRDDGLIPWAVSREHRWAYPLAMLRVEGRRRAGQELRASDAQRLKSWSTMMDREQFVVHYDPATEEGFFYLGRGDWDQDLIRRPPRITGRRAAD